MRGVILAVVVAIILPVHWQKETAKPNKQGNENTSKDKPKEISPATSIPNQVPNQVNQTTTNTEINEPVDESKGYLKRLLGPENLPNIGLLYAGVMGIIIGILTLFVLVAQTNATKRAADAAYLNAEAVIKAQRPWLFIPMGNEFLDIGNPILPDVGDNRVASVTFDLKNFGKTPARVVEQKVYLYIGNSPSSIPYDKAFISTGSNPDNYTFAPDTVIHVQAPLYPNPHITQQDRQAILAGARFLWLCGYCKYRNASEVRDEPPFETRFCFLWVNITNRPEPFWITRGPYEYSNAT